MQQTPPQQNAVNNILRNTVAEIELHYKTKVKPADRISIRHTNDAVELLREYWDDKKIQLVEECKLVLLNQANHVLGILHLSMGGVTGTVVDPKMVFAAALKANANGTILAHNHPSGNFTPSQADICCTEKMRRAAQLLDIRLLDHIILTNDDFFSFADEGGL